MAQRKTSKTKTKKSAAPSHTSFFQRIQTDLKSQQSPSSLLLGALIVIVLAVLAFNFFNKTMSTPTTPQTDSQKTQASPDIAKDKLPGKYNVKEGDTLFTIAEKYYGDGSQFQAIADENKIADVNILITGQVLTIPKLTAEVSPTPTPTASTTETPTSDNIQSQNTQNTQFIPGGIGGAENQTAWGEKITGTKYTVVEGDWLSKIAGRAYGDIFAFEKIAKANNIKNPDLIVPGMVLTIPR